MVRAQAQRSGVRELLVADWDASMARWHVHGKPPGEYESALKSGAAVILPSHRLLRALMRAGMPHADFAFGGKYRGADLLLDEDDVLTEYIATAEELRV